jgi:hypothetical protein
LAFPKVSTLNLALRSGEIVEVDAVAVTTLNEERGLLRVEWEVKESQNLPGKIIYRKRWEGSVGTLHRLGSMKKPVHVWLEGVLE